MPYANEHSARIVSPDKFQEGSFRRKNIESGIDIIFGKLKGETKTTTQAYRFKTSKFTAAEAKAWLKKNKIKYILFEPAKTNSMRDVNAQMEPEYEYKTPDGRIKPITLYTPIYEFACERFIDKLNCIPPDEDIELWLNSPGGSVFGGWSIIGPLSEREGKTTVKVFGDASSMAFYLLLFMDRVESLDVSTFMVHRASGYVESEADQEFLNMVNKTLREKLSKRVDEAKFKEVTGYTYKDIFEGETRIDVNISAKQAKKIGLVDKIIRLEPAQLEAYSSRFINFFDPYDEQGSISASRGSEVGAKKGEEHKTEQKGTIMTKEEFKASNPGIYAEIIAEGVQLAKDKEKDRIEALLTYNEIDPKAVKEAILSGKDITQKFMAEMNFKMMSPERLKALKEEAPKGQVIDKEKESKTKEQNEAEAKNKEKVEALKEMFGGAGLKYEETTGGTK